MAMNIGFLHPGAMGISLAASAQNSGHRAHWVATGRSEATTARAAKHDLVSCESLGEMCEQCAAIVSICPPHAAADVAKQVIDAGFSGLFVDANAIAPQRAVAIGKRLNDAGIRFVDGGVVGGPAWSPGSTWLYLSGEDADEAASYFSAGPLETEVIATEIGKASALKMCYAANTKGSTALICGVLGAAEQLGVSDALMRHWSRNGSKAAEQHAQQACRVTAKAWRFAGEMEEIAATFESVGLPGGFHEAAADIYTRMAGFKESAEQPDLAAVLAALLETPR